MKLIYNTCAFLFCVITLGIVDVEIKYSDGTHFKWVGWITRLKKDRIMDKQNIEKELYKSFITRLIHCTDGARYEEDMVDDYWGLICEMKREYKEKFGEEVE